MTTLIAIALLSALSPGTERGFWIGASGVSDFGGPTFTYYYYEQNREIPSDSIVLQVGDGYRAAAVVAGYAPADWVRFQMSLLELRLEWTGSVSVALAPGLGLSAQFEPPVAWRVRPYVWAGGTWTTRLYTVRPPDVYVIEPMMTFRIGPGVTVRITPRLSAFGETDLWGISEYTAVDTRFKRVTDWETGWLGISRLQAGVRYCLP